MYGYNIDQDPDLDPKKTNPAKEEDSDPTQDKNQDSTRGVHKFLQVSSNF